MGDEKTEFATLFADYLDLEGWIYVLIILILAAMCYVALRLVLLPFLNRMMERTETQWDNILAKKRVFVWLALLAPALILYFGAGFELDFANVLRRVILACIALIVSGILDRILSAALDIYRHFPDDIQIRENRTTVPPPRELHPFRSHPMP